jgi:hypothetical protein
MAWPTTWNGKTIKWIMSFKMSKPHYNGWEASCILEAIVNPTIGGSCTWIWMNIFFKNWHNSELVAI